jgi:hypothetical protein
MGTAATAAAAPVPPTTVSSSHFASVFLMSFCLFASFLSMPCFMAHLNLYYLRRNMLTAHFSLSSGNSTNNNNMAVTDHQPDLKAMFTRTLAFLRLTPPLPALCRAFLKAIIEVDTEVAVEDLEGISLIPAVEATEITISRALTIPKALDATKITNLTTIANRLPRATRCMTKVVL